MKFVIDPLHPDPAVLRECVERFRLGQVGVVPTETVYGLAGVMSLHQAVAKIYHIKERDPQKPMALAVWDIDALEGLVAEVSDTAKMLMEEFWPGPLTLVFRVHPDIPEYVTRGAPTVGVRMPDHEVLLSVIRALQEPLVLTSANLSNRPSVYAVDRLGVEGMDFILDAGETDLRKESTVVDVSNDPPVILRKGVIDPDRLYQFGVFS